MALPFLPAERIQPAFRFLRQLQTAPLQRLVDYVETNWIHNTIFFDGAVPTLYIIVGPCRLVVYRPGLDGPDGVVDPVGFNVVYQTLKWCCLQLSESVQALDIAYWLLHV
jgi:hypothetical protein